ncbi:hypothetical protein DBIPINDM_008147 (plasmid) [Mesorhizobium sp. AR02]|uniref:hypothetical protein n=1 Tax=Mesorhizobium sp. AR02 TaxID=2865837 RepID=UPI00215E71A7|nr:hypothetical protein [Mesorhizobium sp. AR02]UVK57552.1 hypothetical protein DBIPINDM_008147 [Mesorhizobium sp. AR02]
MVLFEPLNSDDYKRSIIYHAALLTLLHDRIIKRFDKVDDAADKVQAAAGLFADAVRPPEAC